MRLRGQDRVDFFKAKAGGDAKLGAQLGSEFGATPSRRFYE